jgi:hypothetical protein
VLKPPAFKDGKRLKNKTPLKGRERAGINRLLFLSRFFRENCKFWRGGWTINGAALANFLNRTEKEKPMELIRPKAAQKLLGNIGRNKLRAMVACGHLRRYTITGCHGFFYDKAAVLRLIRPAPEGENELF